MSVFSDSFPGGHLQSDSFIFFYWAVASLSAKWSYAPLRAIAPLVFSA